MAKPTPQRLSPEGIELLRRFGTTRSIASGSTLFQVGDPGETMYILESGRIELLFLGGKESKQVLPGEPFGELAFFLGGQNRSATAVATETCVLRELGQEQFAALFERAPKPFFNLLREACRYLLRSERDLINALVHRNRELEQALDYLRRTRRELTGDESATLIDPASGLYNLRFLFRQLKQRPSQSCAELARESTTPALILIELEGLKTVETEYGRVFLGQLIRRAGALIREGVGRDDFPCAIAPSRFAIMTSGCQPSHHHYSTLAEHLGKDLQGLLRELPSPLESVAVAMAAALWRGEESGEAVLHRASELLAIAKRRDGDHVVLEGISKR